jgi:hypothetical protein
MKKCLVILLIVMTGVIRGANAQGTISSLQVDSLTYSLPSTVSFYCSYTGLTGVLSAYARVYCNNGKFSSAQIISAGNGNFVVTITGFTSGDSIIYTPKVTFPFTQDGTQGSFVMPACSFTAGISGNSPICAGSSTILTASPSGGTNYVWKRNGTQVGTGETFNASVAGSSYTCDVTFNGCLSVSPSFNLSVISNPTPSIIASTNPICAGTSTSLTASGATSYNWSNGLGTSNPIIVSPSSTTTYTVTGTTASCTGTAMITVNVNTNPTVTVNSPTTCSGVSVVLTAGGANNYSWSNSLGNGNPKSVSPVSTTTYTVTGTDLNGCTGTALSVVTVSGSITMSVNNPAPICFGDSIQFIAFGDATSYSWSPTTGLSNPNIANPKASPLSTTSYTVTGYNALCSKTIIVAAIVNPNPTSNASATGPVCLGNLTTLNATGGIHYHWNTGDTTANVVTTLPVGTTNFIVTVTDINGCSSVSTTNAIVNPNPTVVAYTSQSSICLGEATSLLTMGADLYSWSNSAIGDSIHVSPVVTTDYIVTGTVAGCVGIDTITIFVNSLPNVSVSSDANANHICSGSPVELTASGALSYSWVGISSGNPQTVYPLVTTTYVVTGMNFSGCTNSATITIFADPTVQLTTGGDKSICEGSLGVSLFVSGADTYVWSPANTLSNALIAEPFASPGVTTVYTVIGVRGECSATISVLVEVVDNPNIDSNYYDSMNHMLFLQGDLRNIDHIVINNISYNPFSYSDTTAWFSGVVLSNGQGIYVENTTGCSAFVPYQDVSGISSETFSEIEVSVYPNPFSENLFVELPNGDYKVSLTNVSGQIVREMSANQSFEFSVEDLPSDEGNYLTKLIKN